MQIYLHFRGVLKLDIASQRGLSIGAVCLQVAGIEPLGVVFLISVNQDPHTKLHALPGLPVIALPELVDVHLVADLALQHSLPEGRADGPGEVRDLPPHGGHVVPELTEGDEGGGGHLSTGREDVRRVVDNPLSIGETSCQSGHYLAMIIKNYLTTLHSSRYYWSDSQSKPHNFCENQEISVKTIIGKYRRFKLRLIDLILVIFLVILVVVPQPVRVAELPLAEC